MQSLIPDKKLSQKFSGKYAYMYAMYPNSNFWKKTNDDSIRFHTALSNLDNYLPEEPTLLYLHYPFCEKICFFCSCHKTAGSLSSYQGRPLQTLDAIISELDIINRHFKKNKINHNIKNIHFGGGSPTFLNNEDFKKLASKVNELVAFADCDEVAIEIDPRNVDLKKLRFYREQGITRLSFGVQDFDHDVQVAVNRVQPKELMDRLLKSSLRMEFDSVSFDILSGLPLQTTAKFITTMKNVIGYQPDRVVLLTYNHSPDVVRVQKAIKKEDIPLKQDKDKFWAIGAEMLMKNGYERVGLEHFAKPKDNLFKIWQEGSFNWNMSGYSPGRGNKIIGVGPSAVSKITDDYYFQNYIQVKTYCEHALTSKLPISKSIKLNFEDKIRRDVVTTLRSRLSVDFDCISNKYGVDALTFFKKEIASLDQHILDGIIVKNGNKINATEHGAPFISFVCMSFDAYHPSNFS
jgi:oxygen-independent coproporphyrinogen-3 oxidase